MKNIVIFASGSGTNAEAIIKWFAHGHKARVSLILTNNPNAGVIARAQKFQVDCQVIDRQAMYHSDQVLEILKVAKPDVIVLAGFLWLIPEKLIQAYPDTIVNIHPALLPKYGGKGMYGSKVHETVISNKEKESGITIHYVNEKYDEGAIILQASCQVDPHDTPDTLAQKIHKLEYAHYPKVIEDLLTQ